MASETRYSVGVLAEKAGIQPRTVREYVIAKIIKKAKPQGPATTYPAEDLIRIRAARHLIAKEGLTLVQIRGRFARMTLEQIEALLPATASATATASASAPGSATAAAALGEAWERVKAFPGLELLMRSGASAFIDRIAREIRDRYAVKRGAERSARGPLSSARVHATTSLDELLGSTAGRYLVSPISVSFVVDPSLVGVVAWGRPSADQITTLLGVHERMRAVLAPKTSAIVDVRYLEWPDPAAFTAVVGYLADRGAWVAEYIERMALVRARDGLVGAAGAGFFDANPAPFASASFTATEDALAWLGRDDGAAIAAELDALVVAATGTPAALRKLREHLDARPGLLSLSDAAGALAMSERSLQRELKTHRTSFRAEQHRAQVRAAQRLLRERDTPLAEIALAIGCASLSQLSVLFRRATGQTPSEWRKLHGAAARARHG